MRIRRLRAAALALFAASLAPAGAKAQTDFYTITAPRVSQGALVRQRLGLTDVTITYHRPLVKGRTIWGDVVPYGQVWRAGANENTVITFSDPVTVEGSRCRRGLTGCTCCPPRRPSS